MNDDLLVSVAEIRNKNGMSVEKECDPWAFAGAVHAGNSAEKISVKAEFSVGSGTIFAEGEIRARLNATCARCGEKFESRVSENFDEIYDFSAEFINLAGVAYDALALAQDVKPLCDENCKGLCPRCGTNLNRAACGCATDMPNPFRILKEKTNPDNRR